MKTKSPQSASKRKTLVVLLNSSDHRYDQKFFDPIGPDGEILLEYSLFDAVEAGFEKCVLIVNKTFQPFIRRRLRGRFGSKLELHIINTEPKRYTHASGGRPDNFCSNSYGLWKARHRLKENFMLLSGQHFHGKEVYSQGIAFLSGQKGEIGIISSPLRSTLSEYGHVDRDICLVQKKLNVNELVRIRNIRKRSGRLEYEQVNFTIPSEEVPASAGVYCLSPNFFKAYPLVSKICPVGRDGKQAPYTIADLINTSIQQEISIARPISVQSDFFSIRHKPDRILARIRILDMIRENLYPEKLGLPGEGNLLID